MDGWGVGGVVGGWGIGGVGGMGDGVGEGGLGLDHLGSFRSGV